jgi:DNA-directed RNA polymerase subunit L
MSEPTFNKFNYTDSETLTFNIDGYDCSFANAIRRIIIGEVPTIGFRTEYGRESDIKIRKNTSALHNEFLAHRLSLLPIHFNYNKFDDYDPNKYEFLIQKKNTTNKTINVTTKDIVVKDITKDPATILSDSMIKDLFPPDPITKDYILINRLKPSKSGIGDEGEEMDISMRATMGIGNEHASFCPTCVSIFTNRRDEEAGEEAFKEIIVKKNAERKGKDALSKAEIQKERQSFDVLDADRYFLKDAHGEPNAFTFTIESDGRIPSHIILRNALDIFKTDLMRFAQRVKDTEKVQVYNSDCIMNSFDVAIEDEDYTMGYLMQTYIYKLYKDRDDPVVNYIASNVPHPLENKLVFRIAMVEQSSKPEVIRDLMANTCQHLMGEISKLRVQVNNLKF